MLSIIYKNRLLFGLFIIMFCFALFAFAQNPAFEIDSQAGPTIQNTTMPITSGGIGTVFTITTQASDVSGISLVAAHIQHPDETTIVALTLYDDGTHNDGAANDGTFGNSWNSTGQPLGAYFVDIEARDGFNNSSNQENGAVFTLTAMACTDTCVSLGYQCGTHTICGSPTDCGSCPIASQICCSGICQFPVCVNNNDCNDGNDCTTDTCNNPSSCFANCSNNPIVACVSGDNCCPAGCTNPPDADCVAGCTDDCAIGEFGCMGLNSEWTCGEAGDGDSCLDQVIVSCNAGETCNVAAGICEITCADTCASLGYQCGTQTVCGSPTDCGNCTLPATCNTLGKCVVVSTLSATITKPENNTEYTQGDFINLEGIVLGGVPDYAWEWSSNHDGVFSNNQWGWTNTLSANTHTITLTITDGNTDTATDSINVIVQPAGTLTTQIDMWKTEFADGETIWFNTNVSGGTAPYTFVWNSNHEGNFSTGQCPSVDTSATPWTLGVHTITVTVTDSASNTATDIIDINIAEMTADIMPWDGEHFIFSNSVWFNSMVTGGTAPYTYSWVSDLDGAIGNTDMFNRDDLQQGLHTITVTITDSTPITIIKIFRIQIDPPPVLTVSIDNPPNNSIFNQGDDVSFDGTYSGGMWPYVFTWTSTLDSDIYTHTTDPDFIKNNLSVGTHIIILTATDNSGQTATDAITIIINPASSLVATINSPNNGNVFLRIDDVIDFDGSATGGVSPYTYQWSSNQDGNISSTDKFFKNNLSVNNHTITFTITDSVGATAADSVNIIVNANCSSNNAKNNAKYTGKETFLIADTNWRDVLQLVPLAIWNESGTIHKYPALIYHHETNTKFDADSTIHFMQMYDPSRLMTIGNIPANLNNLFTAAEPVGAGINAGDISNINTSDYFSYWSTIDSLVIVDYNDYKTGLMASVFASHKNSPIIFVNSANLATYQTMINGKTIYTVGNLDGATQGYINSNAGCEVNYTLEELQKWYTAETNSDKLILINSGDWGMGLSSAYGTEKGGWIGNLFGKMSLASPFLAAAKQEVIAYTDLSDPGSNSGCSANAVLSANIVQADADALYTIQNLFSVQPNFLTVIAWPQAIPESEYSSCYGIHPIRRSKDWKYGSIDNTNFELNVGRIYGVTVADASSYAARSIFFDELITNVYGTNYTGTVIALFGIYAENMAEDIEQKTTNSGYNSICIVRDNGDNPSCSNLSSYSYPVPDSVLQNNRFLLFEGHGNATNWPGVTYTRVIPWFDLSYVMGDSCMTNGYWLANAQKNTISVNMLRKGAMAYYGAVSITFGSASGITHCYDIIEELTNTDANTVTLGKVHSSNNDKSKKDYVFLGDPTLQLKLKQADWSCDTGPGCRTTYPLNSHYSLLNCPIISENCYECKFGFTWDGNTCVSD